MGFSYYRCTRYVNSRETTTHLMQTCQTIKEVLEFRPNLNNRLNQENFFLYYKGSEEKFVWENIYHSRTDVLLLSSFLTSAINKKVWCGKVWSPLAPENNEKFLLYLTVCYTHIISFVFKVWNGYYLVMDFVGFQLFTFNGRFSFNYVAFTLNLLKVYLKSCFTEHRAEKSASIHQEPQFLGCPRCR